MISKDKIYRTANNLEVIIYSTDRGGIYPVHGAIKEKEEWHTASWTEAGCYQTGKNDPYNLVLAPGRLRRTVWLNLGPYTTQAYHIHSSAQKSVTGDTIAMVKVSIDCEHGQGLES